MIFLLPFGFLAAALASSEEEVKADASRAPSRALLLTGPGGGSDAPVIDTVREDKPKPPPMYRVVLYDDDDLDGHIVIDTLQQVFKKSGPEAVRIAMATHGGVASTVGVYSKDVAETRIAKAEEYSRQRMMAVHGRSVAITLGLFPEGGDDSYGRLIYRRRWHPHLRRHVFFPWRYGWPTASGYRLAPRTHVWWW